MLPSLPEINYARPEGRGILILRFARFTLIPGMNAGVFSLGIIRKNLRRKYTWLLTSVILVCGIFFLGFVVVSRPSFIAKFLPPVAASAVPKQEVFGFAPYWTLSKMDNVDWDTLTTFAYFSLPVFADGSIDRTSYEWGVFESPKLANLFEKAKSHDVRRVVTLTQMEPYDIRLFLYDEEAWENTTAETIAILNNRELDGVNIDFEFMPSDDYLRSRFSKFIAYFSERVEAETKQNPYITVSVIASSAKDNKIYDLGFLAKHTDGIFMMAYDFYYPGSEKIGPSAPFYGYNNGKGPFWYDVSTAVDDFLKVAPADKIIMGVPYYGWNYPSVDPQPKADRSWGSSFATTQEKVNSNQLLMTTPLGGWDDDAKVSWRGYWDETGWHVVYMEDKKSLSLKYDFAKEKNLAGVGIWALGFDEGEKSFWETLSEKFPGENRINLADAKTH
ncbi:hypothetical protein HY382_01545 [Candidatus Curtissbacteria bacterium]|nr:hypothetical protein [Candidatus Curtissbacteria bacterium]